MNRVDRMDRATSRSAGEAAKDDVDPDIRRFIDEVNAGFAAYPDFAALPLPQAREIAERIRAPWTAGGPQMHSSEDRTVGDRRVAIRLHRPTADADLPVLVYVHGGGWTMFSIDTHDRLMREYAG